jgi:O-antigen ligase
MIRAIQITLSLYAISLLCSMAGMELFGWLSGVLGLIYFIKNRKSKEVNFPPAKIMVFLWGFFLVVVIGALLAANRGFNFWDIVGEARWVILFTLLTLSVQTVSIESQEKFFMVMMLLAAGLGLYGFLQHFWGFDLLRTSESYLEHSSRDPEGQAQFWRTRGFFSHPLTYANATSMIACFPLAYLLNTNFKDKKMIWLISATSLILLLASLATTYARGGWLAFIIGAIVMILIRLPLKKALSLILIGVFALFVLVSQSPIIIKRFLSIFQFTNGSQSDRFNLWAANWEMFKDHPWFGVGYNLNRQMVKPYLEKLGFFDHFLGHAHNIYLQILAGTGLLGFLMISTFFILLVKRMFEFYKGSRGWNKTLFLGALGTQVALIFGGMTEANFIDAEVNHLIIFILVLATRKNKELFLKKGV